MNQVSLHGHYLLGNILAQNSTLIKAGSAFPSRELSRWSRLRAPTPIKNTGQWVTRDHNRAPKFAFELCVCKNRWITIFDRLNRVRQSINHSIKTANSSPASRFKTDNNRFAWPKCEIDVWGVAFFCCLVVAWKWTRCRQSHHRSGRKVISLVRNSHTPNAINGPTWELAVRSWTISRVPGRRQIDHKH